MHLKTVPIPQRGLCRVCFDWSFHKPTLAKLVRRPLPYHGETVRTHERAHEGNSIFRPFMPSPDRIRVPWVYRRARHPLFV